MEIQIDFVFITISVSFVYKNKELFIYKEYSPTVSKTGFNLILSNQNLCVSFGLMFKELAFHIPVGNCCT